MYHKLTACIEGLDSVSESETSDGTEKSNKPSSSVATSSVAENGIHRESKSTELSGPIAGDDGVVAEVLEEIVNKIIEVNDKDDQNRVDGDLNIDEKSISNTSSCLVEKFESERESIMNDPSKKRSSSLISPERELRSTLDQFGMDNAKLQNLIKTFQQHYEESTAKVSFSTEMYSSSSIL